MPRVLSTRMAIAFQISAPRLYEPSKPLRDPKYRAWVRFFPCAVCGTRRGVEAAHTGPHGLGQKAGDDTVIPLCQKDHRTGPQSLHKLGPVRFEEVHSIDVAATRQRLYQFWNELQRRKAA